MIKQAALYLSIVSALFSTGCQTTQRPTKIELSETIYTVKADSQVQFVASDLAARLGVAGVEWNHRLKPWDYKTLRTREINLTNEDVQGIYIELFKDTGLLPYYDTVENRVMVEPFATNTKRTVKFEPAFSTASLQASTLVDKKQETLVSTKKLTRFNVYKGQTLRETVNSWSQQSGHAAVIWYILDPERQAIANSVMEQNIQITERNPTLAIDALIRAVNQDHPSHPLHLRMDSSSKSLIVHGMSANEPMRVFVVEEGDTHKLVEAAAKKYNLEVEYKASKYRVQTEYKTVITSNAERSIKALLANYPLNVTYEEAAKRIVITAKES